MSKGKVLVTPRSISAGGHPALDRVAAAGYEVVFPTPGKQPSEAELVAAAAGCVGYLAGVEPISAAVLEAATSLRVISRNGVGIDNIDLPAARRLGIAVRKAVGANARGVAELTMAHILALTRWVGLGDRAIKAGAWQRRKGIELVGRTLGLIGCGHIGRLVARFAMGLDMKVLAFDVVADASFAPGEGFAWAELEQVLAGGDIISLHCPAPADGSCLIDAAAIARMKKGAFLINTARAELVDQAALAAAIESGHVAGASMDVFRTEPPGEDPLVANDRVLATPHVGGFTDESVDRAVEMAVDNLLEELSSE
ncbi:MAG: (S)-sulfolactate dehydrogenase [Planctomycetes bacterium ADurb.Bin126]|nr:MAG: (S)-sulfolactate dehydrogenase [Planctomycetes bacterium ADurb.Bin126]HOD82695.1 phosphoglycerate dehydrogenase [Phycisphaerae bacterium]HQL72579.1 phosphoglycerate dehydrogenase [Phycisphaerae bacterium]